MTSKRVSIIGGVRGHWYYEMVNVAGMRLARCECGRLVRDRAALASHVDLARLGVDGIVKR